MEKSIFVENDLDLFYDIKYKTLNRRKDDSTLALTINPTLQCNFACSYCFESGEEQKKMTPRTQSNLIKTIKTYDNVRNISITWFGGEPLMAYNVIKNLSKNILKIGKPYRATIITNGYLLTEEIIKSLDSLKIDTLQITIDGVEKIHDKRRPLKSGGKTFEKIVKNIEKVFELSPKTTVGIRVNLDKTNENEYIKLRDYLKKRFEKYGNPNCFVSPGFVDNSTNSCNSISDCLFDRNKKVEFIKKLWDNHNINPIGFFPDNYRYECPIRNPFHFSIGPDGAIYKCWNDIGVESRKIGNINSKKGFNSTLLLRYYVAADPLEDEKCINCFHFPSCGGGCPYMRIMNLYEGAEFDPCAFIKGNEIDFLEYHYKQLKNDNKQ